MTFPTDDILTGPKEYGLRGVQGECDGIIWHTTEGASTSRDAAVATARWQASGSAGSYGFIIYDKESPGSRGGALLTVPYLHASGGVNPFSPAWKPERYPWLKTIMPTRAYNDPNKWQMNIAFSGRTADFAAGRMPANMIDTAARLVLWIQKQPWGADILAHSGHMHWQTNRSDPSQRVLDAIKNRVAELEEEGAPVDNPFIDIGDNKHKNAIIRTTKAGLWNIPDNRKFHPDGSVTRAQMATILDRLLRILEDQS